MGGRTFAAEILPSVSNFQLVQSMKGNPLLFIA